jgi:hypothetical protein
MRNYNRCLHVMLLAFVYSQKNHISHHLQLGSNMKLVNLRVPLAFVIGDAKSGDMLFVDMVFTIQVECQEHVRFQFMNVTTQIIYVILLINQISRNLLT